MKGQFLLILSLLITMIVQAQVPIINYSTPHIYTAGTSITSLTPANTGGAVPATVPGLVSTFAGSYIPGNTDGNGTDARFNNPFGVATDAAGYVYVADCRNNLIRKITPAGIVSTFAGSGLAGSDNGNGAAASFNGPVDLAVDANNNVYVADIINNMIRKITPGGDVSTLAGNLNPGNENGTGMDASFNRPNGLDVDAYGNVYVADFYNNMIRKITADGEVTTLAGSLTPGSTNGIASEARFQYPKDVAIDLTGNLYVSDYGNLLIRKISPAGIVSTFAGREGFFGSKNGLGTEASFYGLAGIAVDGLGNVYVPDQFNYLVRKISPAGLVSTLAGKQGVSGNASGTGTSASFNLPGNVALDSKGNVYVAEPYNHMIRKIEQTGFSISPDLPAGLSFDVKTGAISGTPASGNVNTSYTVTAWNNSGYGKAVLSIEVKGLPSVFTRVISDVTSTSATVKANLVNLGSPNPTQYGVVWSTSPNPTVALATKTVQGAASATGLYTSNLTGLSPYAMYYVKAYATNDFGTAYGSELTFATLFTIPPPNISYNSPPAFTTGTAIAALTPINKGGNVPVSSQGEVITLAGSTTSGCENGIGSEASFLSCEKILLDKSGNIYVAGVNMIRKVSAVGEVSYFAGSAAAGYVNDTGTKAKFWSARGMDMDSKGNIYVAEMSNHLIRKITPSGVVSTFAGNYAGYADGNSTDASFYNPYGLALDAADNIYVADQGNNMIRKITPEGHVSTLAGNTISGNADGTGPDARFNWPEGLCVDGQGNVYVADSYNNMIRKITPDGVVTSLAGSSTAIGSINGKGTAASFYGPSDIAVDALGYLYVTDVANNMIRKISPAGDVTTLAGNRTAGSNNGDRMNARFYTPSGVDVDAVGNLYIGDNGYMIRKISQNGYNISPALPAGLNFDINTGIISGTPQSSSAITTYTVSAYNNYGYDTAVIKIEVKPIQAPDISYNSPQNYIVGLPITNLTPGNTGGAVPSPTGIVSSFAGSGSLGNENGIGTEASFYYNLGGIAVDTSGYLYVADKYNNTIRKITASGEVSTFAGDGSSGSTDGISSMSNFNHPASVAVDLSGNVYVSDQDNNMIRKISATGVVSTLAGSTTAGSTNGAGSMASFKTPEGLVVDAAGNVYVADAGNNMIRKITKEGDVSTFAGSVNYGSTNGTGTAARFSTPRGVSFDATGNLLVADYANHLIRKITSEGIVTTLAGTSTPGHSDGACSIASFNYPRGITVDAKGNVYIADFVNNMIRKISVAGVVSTLAGTTVSGNADGSGNGARFYAPASVAADNKGNIYVSDAGNNKIRKIVQTGFSIAPDLPAGLMFNDTTGTISGTPGMASTAKAYTVKATNSGGSNTTTIGISVNPATGLENRYATGISVYPNPTHGKLKVNINSKVERFDNCSIQLFDVYGNCVKEIELQVLGRSGSEIINLENIGTGIYIYKILNKGQEIYNGKVVVD